MARSSARHPADTPSPVPLASPAGLLLLGVGLVAGCGLMALIGPLGGPAEGRATTGDAPLAAAVERLADRFDTVASQQGELARRMTGLELAMAGTQGTREVLPITADGAPVELSELRESVAQVASALEAGEALAQGPIVNQVIEAMTLLEEREDAEREAEREARRQERLQEQLEELTEVLGLDGNQQLAMSELLSEASARRQQIDEESDSRRERRDARDALIAETQAGAAGFLSPAQLQLLEDSGGLDIRGGRGGGRRGR